MRELFFDTVRAMHLDTIRLELDRSEHFEHLVRFGRPESDECVTHCCAKCVTGIGQLQCVFAP